MPCRQVLIAFVACLALCACMEGKDAASKSNFKAAIAEYVASTKGACILSPYRFYPAETSTSTFYAKSIEQANALVSAGLLARTQTPAKFLGVDVLNLKYTLTDAGSKTFDPKTLSFCAGMHTVEEVVDFTAPADLLGRRVSEATYRYAYTGVPAWAAIPEMQKAYPKIREEMKSSGLRKALLVLTSTGWREESLLRIGSE